MTATASPCVPAAMAMIYVQINGQSEKDLLMMEAIAIPLTASSRIAAEVLPGTVGRVRDPGPLLDLAARQPAGASGVRRRPAQLVRLLDHADREPGLGREGGAGQRATARPDHHDVVLLLGHRAMVATRTCSRQVDDRQNGPVMAAELEITYPPELPVSQRREDIAAAIRDHQVVIVAGETGSGKTTQLPKICLELGRGPGRA